MLKVLRNTRKGLAAAAAAAAVAAGTALPAGPAAAAPQATGGSVFTWGNNTAGQLGDGTTTSRADPEPVAALSPGTRQVAFSAEGFVAALNADGTVSAWGRNDSGQLGNNTTTDSLSPVNVKGLTGVTQISAGAGYMLALRSDGTVWGLRRRSASAPRW